MRVLVRKAPVANLARIHEHFERLNLILERDDAARPFLGEGEGKRGLDSTWVRCDVGGCQEGVRRVLEGCQEGVRRVLEGC
tara:strand:- start:3 stop:245 length:243 start_codon:yes stop_codon:yes gene_type:complete